MKIDKSRLLAVCAAIAALSLGACGGGGGNDNVTPPGPTVSALNKDSYLDAFALVAIATNRLDAVNSIIAGTYATVLTSNDTPGTYPCPMGGTLSYSRVDANTRSFSANNCNLGEVVINSGKLTAVGASATLVGGVPYLAAGDFSAEQLSFTIPDGITGEQTLSGQFKLKRNADLSISASGSASVLRNGRSDVYKDIVIGTSKPDSHHAVDIATLNFTLDTPRFPAPLSVKGNDPQMTVSVPDGAQLSIVAVSSDNSIKFELRPSANATPSLSTTLNGADSTVFEALKRAVK